MSCAVVATRMLRLTLALLFGYLGGIVIGESMWLGIAVLVTGMAWRFSRELEA